ncbi:6,7-dimethyl-8-ribityllumazine synthase [Phaeobacter inhibens]|jgi:6,7-dimethyl-8-ribityllumazine synthase|uniref:6,7-dimethyl-8-ribityllumazine synthase n=1 Tax=Phaeobacter inhibens TaxID=221822 RepID=A0A2I7KGA1_9RHOB|nr:6,7-dimethyl-8-ribityllumazine synthase [Phaeobacter inhibens]AUR01594.1 6,7-dimethyl-8-ribityllumazine synthase RibH [Phaeobacter inhibens]UWS81593.1 6,7-dimethyl-8-ribityllumazine synthase [Phaeobacter sp. G2]
MSTLSIAFIKARWHADIVDQALIGFTAEMKALGQAVDIVTYDVPGAFEMPLLAKKLGNSGRFDGIVAVALVVDGGIYRHDFVAQTVVSGLMQAQLETGVPTYSVSLTPHHFQPVPDLTDFYMAHFVKKGREAAQAVHTMAQIAQKIPEASSPARTD